jgi:dihydrofolate synthase/folylpolyglutamate synthase
MGARLDATNVCRPLASAIVTVDLDHEAHLGSTLAAIAREKAGVLRRGRVTVLGRMARPARHTVEKAARTAHGRLRDAWRGVRVEEVADRLNVSTPWGVYRGLRPLPGTHQKGNLLVALCLLEEASRAGLAFDLAAAVTGFEKTSWPGRLQWIPGQPPLLLDGAHNPAGARALARSLRACGPFTLLFGAMADKNLKQMARILFPLAHAVVLTRAPGERAAEPETIARMAGNAGHGAFLRRDLGEALALARRLAPPGGPVVVAGSLYLVGEVMKTGLNAAAARGGGSAP